MIYDLIVLGGGPAGYLAGERGGHAGLRTLVIEKDSLGGVCLNEGCIPSKALLYSAKIYDGARFGEKYGVKVENAVLDHKKVVARKNKVVKKLVAGVGAALRGNKTEVIKAEGVITGRLNEGYTVLANGKEYTGKNLLIATGSVPVIPPIEGVKEGIESGLVVTNREILSLKEVPEKLVVIGGGVIGLEMAVYYNSAGSHVTIIEMLDHIAGPTDGEISSILMENCKKNGINFNLGAKVTKVLDNAVVFEKDGKEETVAADCVLMSVGRKPRSEGIGLESIGVMVEKGAVVTDSRQKTNIPGVYAAGDINGKSMLAHTAYREAEVVVNNILGKKDIMRYNAIPSVIYTTPEAAAVGETEKTAREKGLDIEVVKLTMNYSGRYMAENEGGDGICKLIIDKKYKRLIGCHVLGSYASEFIMSAVIMVETQMRIGDIKELVFPHPTVCEIIREGIFKSEIGV